MTIPVVFPIRLSRALASNAAALRAWHNISKTADQEATITGAAHAVPCARAAQNQINLM